MAGSVEEKINTINKLKYKEEKGHDDHIFVRMAKKEYKIRNKKDLINFGLKNTYISFDLLEQYCKLFNRSQFEVRFFLDDRDIKLTSDKIDFMVHKADKSDIAAENKIGRYIFAGRSTEIGGEDAELETFSYKSNTRINQGINIEKTIILNLRLNEIIATFLNISHVGDKISYHSSRNFLKKHLREFEKIGLLTRKKGRNRKTAYIVTDECINIAEKLGGLIDTEPNKNLFMDKRLASEEGIKILFGYIKRDFLEILNKFDDFRFLFRLIDDLDNLGKYTMVDIVKYCIENRYESEFTRIFIGNRGTAGKGAIINGRDICHNNIIIRDNCNSNCDICYKKHGINLDNKVDKLLYVRDVVAARRYREIIMNGDLGLLIDDPLTLKFLVKFGVTYYNKNILRALNIINSRVYMKSTGEYCPYRDEWRASKNEI
ncbi:MAG: hypothetical protein ACOX0L_07315 [Natronincolaceae bacterium]|jgi:hypothetical protein